MSISLRDSLGECELNASSLLEGIPREIPKSFHLPARSATADLMPRRPSSSTSKEHTVIANTADNLAVPSHLSLYTWLLLSPSKSNMWQPLLHTECGQLDFPVMKLSPLKVHVATTCTDCGQLKLLFNGFHPVNGQFTVWLTKHSGAIYTLQTCR